jgi:hypothetical protein
MTISDPAPVGTSTVPLSDLLPDNPQGDQNSDQHDDTSFIGNDDYRGAVPNFSAQSELANTQGNVLPFTAQTQAAALGSQALQGGLARSYYQSAVEGLEPNNSLMRSIEKSVTRALSPPIARAYLNVARPGLGSQSVPDGLSGLMNDPVLQYHAGETAGSANVTNASANLIGAGARVAGAGLLGYSIFSAVSQTVSSENRLQTGLTQTGQLVLSVAGGYVAGEFAAVAVEVAVAAAGIAAAPYVAVGAAIVALGASVWGAQRGAVAGFQIGEELYEKLSH